MGHNPGGNTDQIDFITIASTGDGVDFGNMTNANRADGAGFASPIIAFQVQELVAILTLANL